MKKALFYFALVIALTSVSVLLVGEKPLEVFKVLINAAFGNSENISYTLYFATPLLLTGAAVSLALQAGLFNIGAEGQLYVGALFSISFGLLASHWIGSQHVGLFMKLMIWFMALVASFAGGALWGALAGWLRVKRHVHEVIATIMLNFIAMALSNWVILNPLKNPETQHLETFRIHESLHMARLWERATPGIILASLIAAIVLFIVGKTWWGYRVRAVGANAQAAELALIKTDGTILKSMAISGGIAGLVGFFEVFSNHYRLIDGFSAGYGFTGLAIALLARGNFLKLFLSAILFGALFKGSLDLDIETDRITRDLSSVIQAFVLVVLALASANTSRKGRTK